MLLPKILDGSDTARFGHLGALNANECDGRVNVNDWNPENLSVPNPNYGGRAAEVVHAVKTPLVGVFLYGSIPIFCLVFFLQLPSIFPISCNRVCR